MHDSEQPTTFEQTDEFKRLLVTAELMRSPEFREAVAVVPKLKAVKWRDGSMGFFTTELPPSSGEVSFRNVYTGGRDAGDYTTQHLKVPGAIRAVFPIWYWPEKERVWCSCLSTSASRSLVWLPLFQDMCPHILAAFLFGLDIPRRTTVIERDPLMSDRSVKRVTVPVEGDMQDYLVLYDPRPAGSSLVRNLMALAQVGQRPLDVRQP